MRKYLRKTTKTKDNQEKSARKKKFITIKKNYGTLHGYSLTPAAMRK